MIREKNKIMLQLILWFVTISFLWITIILIVIERDACLYLMRSAEYSRVQKYEKCLELLDSCTMFSPRFYRAWYFRGLSYWSLGQYGPALVAFKRSRELTGVPYAQDSVYMDACRERIDYVSKKIEEQKKKKKKRRG